MADQIQSAADMAAAELRVRDAVAAGSPAERLDALMDAYWSTPDDRRDALFAVLAARLTLVRPCLAEPKTA